MTQYDKKYTLPVVIPAESMDNLLANLMANANLRNLRVAETEKYAHVTYFFNGGIEKPFGGEDRIVVPSKKVATYDLAPEMSAAGIADVVIKAVADTAFDVIIMNFANADMVGHSGKIPPTIRAVEVIDEQLGRVYKAVKQRGGCAAGDGGPRKCGDDDRPGDGRAADRAYDQSGAVHSGDGRAEGDDWTAAGWESAGYKSDDAWAAASGKAEGYDGERSADFGYELRSITAQTKCGDSSLRSE